ncbi:MAG: SDR family oxidoreductase [Planctomycetes bacterium]|nr:SDR family oxidoreductase [Planctomycetota bacterium]
MRLTGKTILVTGGGRGLGRALALGLAREGADVAVAARTTAQVEAVAEEVRALGRRALALTVDLTHPESVEAMAVAVRAAWPRLDALINNAGVFAWKDFLALSVEEFDRSLATNLRGAFLACKAVVPGMIAAGGGGGGGAIVNIASVHGRHGDAKLTAHCAAKFGLLGFTEALACDLRKHGIRVNAVCPGAIEYRADAPGADAKPPLLAKVWRDDVAKLVIFLCSDDARQITGSSFDLYGTTELKVSVL